MARWQFDLYLVEYDAQALRQTREGRRPPLLPISLAYMVQEELAHYLGPPWQMLNDWLVFGPENGNRIDFLFDADLGVEVYVRCDVRQEAPQFLALVADLTRFHGCRFFSPLTNTFIEPDLEQVTDAIRTSQATRGAAGPT